ncbi:MAG: TonB-dependent receptor [Pseudomonadota bacterium]
MTAPEIDGAFTEADALTTLLAQTDLEFAYINDRTIAIVSPSANEPEIQGSAQSVEPITLAQAESSSASVPAPVPEEPRVLDTIKVPGFRSSLASSLERKRNANQIIDAITAEDIGQFPDQNLTESIQRIAGVQITRNNGEGEQVNIRGLSAQFTRVELDGRSTNVTIDSADPERGSSLSVFASDLYNSIEVIKSPTAADVEGGVGGIVRLKTPDPLDLGKMTWGLEGGLLRSDVRDADEPSLTGFYSNVYGDGKIGLLLAGTFEQRDRSIDKIQSNQDWIEIEEGDLDDASDPALQALIGGFYPGRIRQEQREVEVDKVNLNGKLQIAASEALTLSLDGLYTQEARERQQSRLQSQFSRTNGITDGEIDPNTNTLLSGTFNRVRVEPAQFFRDTDVVTYGVTGSFDWSLGDWDLSGETFFSSAEEEFTETRVSGRENRTVSYTIANDPEYPELTFEAGDLDLDGFSPLRQLDQQIRTISIEEQGLSFDAERALELGALTSFAIGGRLASTEFDRSQAQVESSDAGDLGYSDGAPPFVVDGSFADGFGGDGLLRVWPSIDPLEIYNRFPSSSSFSDATVQDENIWTLTEDTLAGYIVGNYEQDNLFGLFARGNVGVRVVQTSYEGNGIIDLAGDAIEVFNGIGTQTLDRDYTDVLPSFNIVMSQDSDSNFLVRGAISRAMTRPQVADIQPGFVVRIDDIDSDTGLAETNIEIGNPDLDPFRAWQYDLGFEWYFGENNESALTAAVFYKDVENFVLTTDDEDTVDAFADEYIAQSTRDLIASTAGLTGSFDFQGDIAVNGGEATIQGVELGLQTPFYFLPGNWSNFGIAVNYTYTDSEFTSASGETLPFPGSSENSFNLVGYYEQGGFSGRLAYTYRDEFLIDQGGQTENVQFNDEDGRLDLGLRYRFENGLRFSFDALNLTEEQNYKYYDTPQRLEDIEVEGRIYQISVGYKF